MTNLRHQKFVDKLIDDTLKKEIHWKKVTDAHGPASSLPIFISNQYIQVDLANSYLSELTIGVACLVSEHGINKTDGSSWTKYSLYLSLGSQPQIMQVEPSSLYELETLIKNLPSYTNVNADKAIDDFLNS